MGNAPLLDDTSRIEMRLLSETRSVLEYLYRHSGVSVTMDKVLPYSFPKIAVLGNVIRLADRGRAELRPTGRYNRTCAMVVNAPDPSQQWKGDAFKVTHG
jgi:hypothetical protein